MATDMRVQDGKLWMKVEGVSMVCTGQESRNPDVCVNTHGTIQFAAYCRRIDIIHKCNTQSNKYNYCLKREREIKRWDTNK